LKPDAQGIAPLMPIAMDENRHTLSNRTLIVQDMVAQAFAGSADNIQYLRQIANEQLLGNHYFMKMNG
jgi:hypothetical protein